MTATCQEVEYSVLGNGPYYKTSDYFAALRVYETRYWAYEKEALYTDLAEKPRMFKSIINTTEYEWDGEEFV